ncbi:R-spondin-1 [Platysternon megacephalum]|uniref:R-spondin-1 n=1 Tax=Platysternon megacephalum TaxID=55544 RepID=A0A4D9ERI7_9SAUR|nr:R-spondin-1 [Platysternon megacephalum]
MVPSIDGIADHRKWALLLYRHPVQRDRLYCIDVKNNGQSHETGHRTIWHQPSFSTIQLVACTQMDSPFKVTRDITPFKALNERSISFPFMKWGQVEPKQFKKNPSLAFLCS